ncbi:hypothetical protein [Altererythrobacter sp. ZODW24]|uniref:hypothetical protein n=1 Tax=Altererythrobacter sp. ZODW24 TaxID=2185142 RepID=UPI001F07C767|nr:hypothetical protein [Altererythrobacter sp. ZODW24]
MDQSDTSERQRAIKPAVHFVGFRDDRYWNAVRIWGEPSFIHETWDTYAKDEVAPGDVVVFARGEWDRSPKSFSKKPKC